MKIRIEYNGDHIDGSSLAVAGSFRVNLSDGSHYMPSDPVENFDGATLAEAIAYGHLSSFEFRACDYLNRLQKLAMNHCTWEGQYCFECQVLHVGHPAQWPCTSTKRRVSQLRSDMLKREAKRILDELKRKRKAR